jgi:hypothetical protein
MVQQDKPQMTIWRMHIARWILKAKNTHSEYVILNCSSTAIMLTRTLFNIPLHVHCQSCLDLVP